MHYRVHTFITAFQHCPNWSPPSPAASEAPLAAGCSELPAAGFLSAGHRCFGGQGLTVGGEGGGSKAVLG